MAKPTTSTDVAVIGLGAMGAAALYQLARQGVKAIGIDRFSPPHEHGSTHGETRITRQGIGEGEWYAPLALRSHEIWRDLEAQTGESLLVETGCLIIASAEGSSAVSRKPDFMTQTRSAAERYGIPYEMLDAAEIRRRFPQFTPGDHEIGYFEPGGGYVRPEQCIAAQLQRARALGAETRLGTVVLAVASEGDGVRIATDAGDILAGQAIVSAGAWAPGLLGAPFDTILTPMRQVMHWFETQGSLASHWTDSPTYIWQHRPDASGFFYGFPALPGSHVIKAATEQYEVACDPDRVEREVGPSESRDTYDEHLAGRLKGIGPQAVRSITCLYTVTPDSGFVIDRHPDHERILVLSPCSGHGFKHSAAIGEAAAQIVSDGRSTIDLSAFGLSRFRNVRTRDAERLTSGIEA
jgi:sarcosine oxidase